MDTFPETNNFPRLNQEEIENRNRPITSNELESVIKNLPTNKRTDGFKGGFYKTFKEELTPILSNYSKKLKRKECFQTQSTRTPSP